ncbi:hypothetical protein A2U01_0088568, partial [Trifolium medium]|nr:hypothetical protein [Trifolium medium]
MLCCLARLASSQRAAGEKRSECLPGSGETLSLSELSRLA